MITSSTYSDTLQAPRIELNNKLRRLPKPITRILADSQINAFILDSEVEDWKFLLLLLNRQVAYQTFNLGEVGFSQVNLLAFKEIDFFQGPNIGIEVYVS